MAILTVTLPPEIITEILSRLPVKPLCRFKCVSKPFKILINSPIFIKLHLSKTLISDNPNLIFSGFSLSISPINNSNPTILRFTELHQPSLHTPDSDSSAVAVKILGSCNGILCISPFDKIYACLYNPITSTLRSIPPTPSRFPNPNRRFPNPNSQTAFLNNVGHHQFVYGFGYDSYSDDYKLLRFLEYYKDNVFVGREACLFSLKNGVWKFVCDDDVSFGFGPTECCFVNDVLYFVVDNNGMIKPFIKCFNLRTECFSNVELPNYDERFNMFHIQLRELGGCLCMFLNNLKDDSNARAGYRLESAEMWIMNESWVKLFSISDTASVGVGASMHIKPIVYSKDRRRVLLELDCLWFGWYDWERKKFVKILAHGLPPHNAPLDTWTFVESLVSLGNDDGKLKGKTVQKKKKKDDVDGFLSSEFKLKL